MKKPCLVIDVGNSVLHWGLSLDGQHICETGKLRHRQAKELVSSITTTLSQPPQVLVASVNPKPMPMFREGLEKYGNIECLELKAGSNWQPQVQVDHPGEVGVDRLINARAIKEDQPEGGIVVDHGTALTIDWVAAKGIYAGGVIVPGIMMSTKALAEKTSLIPLVDFAKPASVIGKNTAECIRSGLYFGLVGLVQHLVALIREQNNPHAPVIVTGGDAEFIVRECNFESTYCPLLTLQGMLKIGWDINFWSQ